MKFTKMHGIGNDFIVMDGAKYPVEDPAALARRLCQRRFGVGADGLILALPSDCAHARMRIFNADGTEPEMCGNGIRCLGKFLYDTGLCRENPMTVQTLAGVLTLSLEIENGSARRVTVDMGAPRLSPEEIPVRGDSNQIRLAADGRSLDFFCVSMGNPHAVTFDLFPEDEAFYRLGAALERHEAFPRRANIEFCRVNPDGSVSVRVWERGAGPTLACGTGACAVLTAAASLGLTGKSATVRLPGGDLDIRWGEDGHLFMTGDARTVYEAEIDG